MENRVRLEVLGITYNQIQNGAYVLVLAEMDGPRRIPIVIGTAEAQSIVMRLGNKIPPRPMTHDLFVCFAHGFGVRLVEVFIYSFKDGIFASELLFDDGERQMRIDSRTSDAIAIALRTQSPIYTTPEILAEAGFIIEESEPEPEESETSLSEELLREQLEKAVAAEEYEEAARLQAILNKLLEDRSELEN